MNLTLEGTRFDETDMYMGQGLNFISNLSNKVNWSQFLHHTSEKLTEIGGGRIGMRISPTFGEIPGSIAGRYAGQGLNFVVPHLGNTKNRRQIWHPTGEGQMGQGLNSMIVLRSKKEIWKQIRHDTLLKVGKVGGRRIGLQISPFAGSAFSIAGMCLFQGLDSILSNHSSKECGRRICDIIFEGVGAAVGGGIVLLILPMFPYATIVGSIVGGYMGRRLAAQFLYM